MSGIFRRENLHPNKWVDLIDKSDCWVKRRENMHPDKWQTASVFRRESGGWNQMYPRVSVQVSNKTINCGGDVGYKNNANSSWIFDGTARQGSWSTYGTYGGFCDLHCSAFDGSGMINQLDAASFSGTRNGSGYTTNNQNVYFQRSEQHPKYTGGAPYGYAGQFISTTGAPGSGGRMNNRGLLNWDSGGRSNCMDWMNGVGAKGWLHIGGVSTNADYMGMSAISFMASYWFSSTYRMFSAAQPSFAISSFATVDIKQGDVEHGMLIYPGEEGMSLPEIFERREILGLSDINENDAMPNTELDFRPVNGDYYVKNGNFFIRFHNMKETSALYYSYDNINWNPAYLDIDSEMYVTPYEDRMNKIYLRVVNFKTDELLYEESKDIDVIQIYGPDVDFADIIPMEELNKYNK